MAEAGMELRQDSSFNNTTEMNKTKQNNNKTKKQAKKQKRQHKKK